MAPSVRRAHGFTLIEVLVALTILAIALAAAARAASIATDSAAEVKERILATWVAQNQMATYQARGMFPDLGDRTIETEQAGVRFQVTETVQGTPNPIFRRVEIRVLSPRKPGYTVARIVGYVIRRG